MSAVVDHTLILLHLLLELLLLHEANAPLPLLHSLRVADAVATSVAAVAQVVDIAAVACVVGTAAADSVAGVIVIEIRIPDG